MYKKINLLRDPIWPLLRKVTIPASIGSLFQTFYNLVDTYFAGKISPEALSALAKSFPIYFVIIAIGVGVGAATNTLIGNSIGEKNEKRASMYVGGARPSSFRRQQCETQTHEAHHFYQAENGHHIIFYTCRYIIFYTSYTLHL